MPQAKREYDYKVVNASWHRTVEDSANYWACLGWRVVGVISGASRGHAHQLVLERSVYVSHPDD